MYKRDGSFFVGSFNSGIANGHGLYILPDGSYYEGAIYNNMAESEYGRFYCPQFRYEGEFKQNQFYGDGKETGANYTYSGTYIKGNRICG